MFLLIYFLLIFTMFQLRYANKLLDKKVSQEPNIKDILPVLKMFPLFAPRTPSARKVKSSTPTAGTINYGTPHSRTPSSRKVSGYTSSSNSQLDKGLVDNSRNLTTWLENIGPRLNMSRKNFRRTNNEGLMHFKSRMNKTKSKKPKRFIQDDIIPNNKYELENILADSESNRPNFNEDFIELTTRRFNKIEYERLKRITKEVSAPSNISEPMRRHFFKGPRKVLDKEAFHRVLALMTQFVYLSQDKMKIGQRLRTKYIETVKYKIGFLFALLRILKQQQMRLYSSMHFYRFYTPDKTQPYNTDFMGFTYYFNLYAKLLRLDDDIVVAVQDMWGLEDERVKAAMVEATKFPKRQKMTPVTRFTFFPRETYPPGGFPSYYEYESSDYGK